MHTLFDILNYQPLGFGFRVVHLLLIIAVYPIFRNSAHEVFGRDEKH